jgi:hypothetical protein
LELLGLTGAPGRPERWAQVRELFDAALERERSGGPQACAFDREVQVMLLLSKKYRKFMDR